MDYVLHYDILCERAKNRNLDCYTERHHILPKCMGGDESPENLVDLTPEEHYVAHQLLVKIYPENSGLVQAATLMTVHSKGEMRVNNKLYGWLRRRASKIAKRRVGDKNGSYGRKWFHNPKTLENIKCYPEDVPEGFIPGRKIKTDKECIVCGSPTSSRKANYCSKQCRVEGNRKLAYGLLKEFVNSNFRSINKFSKYKQISQQRISNLWITHVDGYDELTKNKVRDKEIYLTLLED